MKERLVIKNFGPIKSVDLELGKMTILIGEQATGKSTIAKVLAVCRYFSFITDATNNLLRFENIYFDSIFKEYGIHEFINDDSYILYENEDYDLEIQSLHDQDSIIMIEENQKYPVLKFHPAIIKEKSERFKLLMAQFNKIRPKVEFANIVHQMIHVNWNIPSTFLLNEVKNVMDNPFYFPTERGLQSVFSLGKESIQNLSNLLYSQFVQLNEISNHYSKEFYIRALDMYYKNDNGFGFLRKTNNERFFSLSNGASGFQSATPIFLGINYYTNVENRHRTFIVEEPELNLFPKAQKKLMEFFVENINTNGHSFLLPTHSPYILSSLNNMMYAHSLGTSESGRYKEKVGEIVPKEFWINAADVSAYYLKDGIAIDIVNREESQIRIEDLDSVSELINREFDELLNIEVEAQV